MSKKWKLILGFVACALLSIIAVFLMLNTTGQDVMKMRVIYVALFILGLHGCYRACYHLRGEHEDEIDVSERMAREANGPLGVVGGFFNPKTARFRTVLSLVILVVAYQLANPVVFWSLLVLFVVVKGAVLWQLLRYRKAYNKLIDVQTENQMIEDDHIHQQKIERLVDELQDYMKDSIHLTLEPVSESPIPIGSSKFGGVPDVPADFVWPKDDDGCPLSLLLQIDCADLAAHDRERLLPQSGHLYFFYELTKMDWDNDHHGVKVIYNETPAEQLHREPYPDMLKSENRLSERRVVFSLHQCLPDPNEKDLSVLFDGQYSEDDYFDACDWFNNFGGYGSMLGYASIIQNPICDDLDNNVLLLQLFTIEETDLTLMFGDCGIIYFYISREDLMKRNFDRVDFELQCY